VLEAEAGGVLLDEARNSIVTSNLQTLAIPL
jgi:hypothetical protein